MLPLIFDTCVPRDEILSGDLSLDLFAAKLWLVVEGTAPQVDRDANKLFANTFATDGIKTLIREVFSRLISKTERIYSFQGSAWERISGGSASNLSQPKTKRSLAYIGSQPDLWN